VEAAPDEIIFQKGAPAEKMYTILGGEVAIEDEGRLLATLARGDMFGEMALLSDAPRSATARAAASVSLLALDRDTLQNAMSREVSTQLLLNIIVTLSGRLRAGNDRLRAT
jgi:CRP-like cAMP-binding protein